MNITIRLQLTERDEVLKIKPNPEISYDPATALEKMNTEAFEVLQTYDDSMDPASIVQEDVDRILGVAAPSPDEDIKDEDIKSSSSSNSSSGSDSD